MRKYLIMFSVLFLLFIGLLEQQASAAIADGTHSLNFQVNKPGSSSASMANDYFAKPAKLIVSNGSMKVQMTIKNSSWVTQFNPPGGASVISSNPSADARVVQFSISNLNTLKVAMKIDIDDIDYHHAYTVDFVFDGSGLPEKKEQAVTPPSSNNSNSNSNSDATADKPAANKPSSSTNSNSTNSNTSSTSGTNTQADNKEPVTSTTEEQNNTSKDDVADSETTTEGQEENPETSDQLPLYAMVLFALALVVFISTKKRKTI